MDSEKTVISNSVDKRRLELAKEVANDFEHHFLLIDRRKFRRLRGRADPEFSRWIGIRLSQREFKNLIKAHVALGGRYNSTTQVPSLLRQYCILYPTDGASFSEWIWNHRRNPWDPLGKLDYRVFSPEFFVKGS